jgi:hypothetical protein
MSVNLIVLTEKSGGDISYAVPLIMLNIPQFAHVQLKTG